MKVYEVGGAVRDALLVRPVADRDWVVVGATPQAMIDQGYRPVGRDFPVFLHPQTHEEYALARTERKSGRGYHGFTFHASPEVTLEDDLRRRDLTINAMARDESGQLIDPFGGARDLRAGVLRHVSPAFAEDPLRVLRVARFAARFGFGVAPETEGLMRELAASGELVELSPERVWQELARGLMEPQPSRMLAVLRACGALAAILPEVDALYGVPQPPRHHPEFDSGVHVAMALDYCARHDHPLPVRYAVLTHDLGKATSDAGQWPKHHAHEMRSIRLAKQLSERLRVPKDCRDAARITARYHGVVHRAAELRPATFLELFMEADAFRRPERLERLLLACEADARSRPGHDDYRATDIVREAFAAAKEVDAGEVARRVMERAGQSGRELRADAVPKAIAAERTKAVAEKVKRPPQSNGADK